MVIRYVEVASCKADRTWRYATEHSIHLLYLFSKRRWKLVSAPTPGTIAHSWTQAPSSVQLQQLFLTTHKLFPGSNLLNTTTLTGPESAHQHLCQGPPLWFSGSCIALWIVLASEVAQNIFSVCYLSAAFIREVFWFFLRSVTVSCLGIQDQARFNNCLLFDVSVLLLFILAVWRPTLIVLVACAHLLATKQVTSLLNLGLSPPPRSLPLEWRLQIARFFSHARRQSDPGPLRILSQIAFE